MSLESFASTISPFVALIIAVVIWWLNEKGKRDHIIYIKKLERYEVFLNNLKGFYDVPYDQEIQKKFVDNLPMAWLYAPPEVLDRANEFIEKQGQDTVNALLNAIRDDIKLKRPKKPFKGLTRN